MPELTAVLKLEFWIGSHLHLYFPYPVEDKICINGFIPRDKSPLSHVYFRSYMLCNGTPYSMYYADM